MSFVETPLHDRFHQNILIYTILNEAHVLNLIFVRGIQRFELFHIVYFKLLYKNKEGE